MGTDSGSKSSVGFPGGVEKALHREPSGCFGPQLGGSLLWDLALVWPLPGPLSPPPLEIPSSFHTPKSPLTEMIISGRNCGPSLDLLLQSERGQDWPIVPVGLCPGREVGGVWLNANQAVIRQVLPLLP